MIKIRKVEDERAKIDFIELPWKIYKNDENWVPPLKFDVKNNLNPAKNPFFKHSEVEFFLAETNDEIVGRIAAIKNDNHNKVHNDKSGFFGFFESINNKEVSDLLLNAASEWCYNKGLDKIIGPMSPSTNDECGLLIDGFDKPPVILMPYNPPYYQSLIESFGFKKEMDMYAYDILSTVINDKPMINKLERMVEIVKKRYNIVLRTLDMSRFNEEVKKVQAIYNNAWEKNWGFVPLTDDEIDYMAKSLKMIVDPEFVVFAEVNGEPVGFTLTLPDINQVLIKMNGKLFPFGIFKLLLGKKKINNLRVIIMGVKREFHKRGIDAIFYLEMIKAGNRKGYRGAEISWVLENNHAMRQTAENLGAYIYKTYRFYSKDLN